MSGIEVKRDLIRHNPLSVLSGSKLGIDASHYIKSLFIRPSVRTSLAVALGGLSKAFRSEVETDLKLLKQGLVDVVWVFDGIDPARVTNRRIRSYQAEENGKAARRAQAWDGYDRGRAEQAYQIFSQLLTAKPSKYDRYIQKILFENNVEYIVAPYLAIAQLAYMANPARKCIDATYCAADIILYGHTRAIVSLDWGQSSFSWIDKADFLRNSDALTESQFLDACLLAGSDGLATFPLLEAAGNYGTGYMTRAAQDIVKFYHSGANAIMSFADLPPIKEANYFDNYCRARCMITHHIVLTTSGTLEPLVHDNAPENLHEIMGQRLPEEIYFYLSRGLIGPTMLQVLVSGTWTETRPLDNGDMQEYRKFIDDLLDMRTLTLSLVAQPIHRFYQFKGVQALYWFRDTETEMVHRVDPYPRKEVDSWSVSDDIIGKSISASDASKVTLRSSLSICADDELQKKTFFVSDGAQRRVWTTTNEIVANVFLRTLQFRSFVRSDHTLSPWGQALHEALSVLGPSDLDLQWDLLVAYELFKLNIFRPERFSIMYKESSLDENIMFLCRMACFIRPRQRADISWQQGLNRNFLAFVSFISTFTQSLRCLIDMNLLSALLNGDAERFERTEKQWCEIPFQLPFLSDEHSAVSAIVMKHYLTKSQQDVNLAFPSLVDAKEDVVCRVFRFWDAFLAGLKRAESVGACGKLALTKYLAVDTWVQQYKIKD